MLIQLIPTSFAAAHPLFASLDFNLVIHSMVEGNTPAWVFADDPLSPQVALMWDRQDALLVAGGPTSRAADEITGVILKQIVPDARARGIPGMALFYTPGWEPYLRERLANLNPKFVGRLSYRMPNTAPFSQMPAVPEGFELRRIDDGLLVSHLVHLEAVRGWIDSFWASPQDFLHTGFGYCATIGDTIAAWCLTVFAAGNARELGLITLPDYRNRGLATLVGAACIEHALAHELIPHWHCWADNRPSAAVADKLGFQLERRYTVYRLSLL